MQAEASGQWLCARQHTFTLLAPVAREPQLGLGLSGPPSFKFP